jgi:hypothetical protein
MLVLDGLQDDVEQIGSIMRVLAEWRPCLREEYTSEQVLEALRRLLLGGFVAALEESIDEPVLVPVRTPDYSPTSLRRYWFEATASGRSLWEAWDRRLDRN